MDSKINLHFERLRLKELPERASLLWAIGGFFCTVSARPEGAVLFSAYSAFLLQFSAKEMSAAFLGAMTAFLLLPKSSEAILFSLGALMLFAAWFHFFGAKKTLPQQSAILGLLCATSNLALALLSASGLLMPIINACATATAYALLESVRKNIQNRRVSMLVPKKEELLCPFLLLLMLILGTSGLVIGGINLQHVLFHALLLLAVSNADAAFAIGAGLFLGLAGTLSSGENAALIGYLALCASIGSFGGNYGRLGIFIAYASGSLLLGWIISDWYGLMYLAGEILAASIIFFATPSFKSRPAPLTKHRPKENGYAKIAQAVGVLSRPRPELISAAHEESATCAQIYLRVCHDCANKELCWQKNPENTKKALEEAYHLALSLGPQAAPLSENLKRVCLHSESLREALTAQIMLEQKEEKHFKELAQMQEACHYELSLISKALRELNYVSNNNYEHTLRCYLTSQSLPVQYVRLTLHDGAFTAEIVLKECIKECEQAVAALLSAYFKQEYLVFKRECNWQNQYCRLFLRPAEKYFLSVHAVQRRARGENLCGDVWRHFKINEHLECVLLIDGMGIGEKAYRQSSYAADLLEEMLKNSIATADALNLTNNHLLLAGLEENFISLELLLIDTFDFSAEFYKACGSISYFLHDSKVQKLTAQALPLGILAEGRAQKQLLHFKCGDRLLILSDGMAENGVNWAEILPTLSRAGAEAVEEILRLAPESADDQSAILLDIWSIKQNGS